MHNWRLLLLAFLAVFHPIASFTERSLVDGREPCCDRQQHSLFRDTRVSYGNRQITKPQPENRRLSRGEIREDRRYEVRQDDSTLAQHSTDRRLVEYRSERGVNRISPEQSERFTRVEYRREIQRIASRDINRDIRARDVARVRLTRNSYIRQNDRENPESVYVLSRDNSRFVRSINDERRSISMSSRRDVQRNRDSFAEIRRIQEAREARNVLQRVRTDVARSDTSEGRNDRRIEREMMNKRRAFVTRSESRLESNNNIERRSMDQRRVSMEGLEERRTVTARSVLQRQFLNNSERRSVVRNDNRISRQNGDERRALVRSESRLVDGERHSLDRGDRVSTERVDDQRESTARSTRLGNNREDSSERRIVSERTDRRSASTVRPELRGQMERRMLDRRVSRESINEQRAFTTQPVARIRSDVERRSLDRNERRTTREKVAERDFVARSKSDLNRGRRSIDRSIDRVRNVDRDSRLNNLGVREERQRLNTRREAIETSVERRQQRDARLSTDRTIRRDSRQNTLVAREYTERWRSVRLERSTSLNDVRTDRETRANNRGASETRGESENFRELRDGQSSERFTARDTRRENRLSRSFDVSQDRVEREDFRFRTNTGINRSRESFISFREKTLPEDQTVTVPWQYVFYTLQGIYLCGILVEMLADKGTEKKKLRSLRWWTASSHSLVKVD